MTFSKQIIDHRASKYHFIKDGKKQSVVQWIDSMLKSNDLILEFNQVLKESTFEAYFWEVKPVNQNSINESFEFVLVNSSSLKSIKADDQSFHKYFDLNKKVVSFPNLRKDAALIVPTPISQHTEYALSLIHI